jgi:hypothetical protein
MGSWEELRTLVWSEWRRAAWWGPLLTIACAGAGGLIFYTSKVGAWMNGDPVLLPLNFAGVTCAILGVLSMRDAVGGPRFTFLSERGAGASAVWLSRVLVWFTWGAIAMALSIGLGLAAPQNKSVATRWDFEFLLVSVCAITGAFWFGCLSSILFSSVVTAILMTGVFMYPLAGALVVLTNLDAPAALFCAPLVAVVAFATFVRLSDLLRGTIGWRESGRLWGTLLLPVIPWLVCIGFFRIVQIPHATAPGPETYPYSETAVWNPTPEQLKTAALYDEALNALSPEDRIRFDGSFPIGFHGWDRVQSQDPDILHRNAQALKLTQRAAARPDCALIDPLTQSPDEDVGYRSGLQPLLGLLLCDARRLESEGKLDEALDQYVAALRMGVHFAQNGPPASWNRGSEAQRFVLRWLPDWLSRPDQTPGRLMKMQSELKHAARDFPSMSQAMQTAFATSRIYAAQGWVWAAYLPSRPREAIRTIFGPEWRREQEFAAWLPSERVRALRLIDRYFQEIINPFAAMDIATSQAPMTSSPSVKHKRVFSDQRENRWLGSTPGAWEASQITAAANTGVMARRLLDLRLAVVQTVIYAWKLEKGAFPDRLDQLVGKYLEELPIDPFTGREFGYFPQGVKQKLLAADDSSDKRELTSKPFLWVEGPEALRLSPVEREGQAFMGVFSPTGLVVKTAEELNLGTHLYPLR